MTEWLNLMEATWPAARRWQAGPWILRDGKGGGGRVSATTAAHDDWSEGDIAIAEAAHHGSGQVPLFMVRDGEDRLDAALAARGYALHDPVDLFMAPVSRLAAEAPRRLTTFAIWPMLAIMRDHWAEAGIGPERIAVMERAAAPKTTILGRLEDRAAGGVFAAVNGDVAYVHALHVLPGFRRKGLARDMMRAAAQWAATHGARSLALPVTRANDAGQGLYRSLGMEVVDHYHYRRLVPAEVPAA